jgi:hypothetical protein
MNKFSVAAVCIFVMMAIDYLGFDDLLIILVILIIFSFKGFLRLEVEGLECYSCVGCSEPFITSSAVIATCSETDTACVVCFRDVYYLFLLFI